MLIEGRALTFGDNVDTDQIIGAEHLTLASVEAMVPYALKHDASFVANFRPGDILVGGHNFGCGSSREQAPAVLKVAGVGAIVARGFARIFYRNAINLGLPVIECDRAGEIADFDELRVDTASGRVWNSRAGCEYAATPLPAFIARILEAGGIVNLIVAEAGEVDHGRQ